MPEDVDRFFGTKTKIQVATLDSVSIFVVAPAERDRSTQRENIRLNWEDTTHALIIWKEHDTHTTEIGK